MRSISVAQAFVLGLLVTASPLAAGYANDEESLEISRRHVVSNDPEQYEFPVVADSDFSRVDQPPPQPR
jgi:hypothetical protein